MNAATILALAIGIAASGSGGGKGSVRSDTAATTLAALCVSADSTAAADARRRLRAMGPQGLATLFEVYDHAQSAKAPGLDPDRFHSALDEVAGQRDAHASRLYWHTDLESARAAASSTGKPILSLRMMGKLTDEYSCANSRFFRTALYANASLSHTLRDRFVLHWQSVRPVPQVTIDFGDGRVLRRTLTGNSAHYILDQQGRVVDVLPGLYGPQAFMRRLASVEEIALRSGEMTDDAHLEAVREWHSQEYRELLANWRRDLDSVAAPDPSGSESVASKSNSEAPPTARKAAAVAVGKRAVEQPILERIDTTQAATDAARLGSATNEETWRRIAELHADEARLDERSRAVMASHLPAEAQIVRCRTVSPLGRMAHAFEEMMALDTVRNEYLLHRQLHAWFLEGGPFTDAVALNERVYDELFLTPRSDPWFGLAPADTYTALGGDGRLE